MSTFTPPKDTKQNDLTRFADDRPIRNLGYLIVIMVFVFLAAGLCWRRSAVRH